MGKSRARVVIHYGQHLPTIAGSQPVKCSALMHLPVGWLAVDSLLQVQKMVCEVTVGLDSGDEWQSGRVSGTAAFQPVAASKAVASDSEAFDEACSKHNLQVEQMRQLLHDDGSQDMLDWGQRLGPSDLTDFPSNLKKAPPQLSRCGLKIPDPHIAVKSVCHNLPAKVDLPVREAPLGWLSAVRPKFRAEARRRVEAFRKKTLLG